MDISPHAVSVLGFSSLHVTIQPWTLLVSSLTPSILVRLCTPFECTQQQVQMQLTADTQSTNVMNAQGAFYSIPFDKERTDVACDAYVSFNNGEEWIHMNFSLTLYNPLPMKVGILYPWALTNTWATTHNLARIALEAYLQKSIVTVYEESAWLDAYGNRIGM
jgi:hypothetical protein